MSGADRGLQEDQELALKRAILRLPENDIDRLFLESILFRSFNAQTKVALLESERSALANRVAELEAALEIVRPHVDLMQAHLNGSYCVAKIDEHTFCGRGRDWPGHLPDAKEWPEHEFVDGSALVRALLAKSKPKCTNPHCLNDGKPCAPDGAGGCLACAKEIP